MDWKSSWMLALNCSSSIPQVAREYRMRDWTMNLKRYSKACRGGGQTETVSCQLIICRKKKISLAVSFQGLSQPIICLHLTL